MALRDVLYLSCGMHVPASDPHVGEAVNDAGLPCRSFPFPWLEALYRELVGLSSHIAVAPISLRSPATQLHLRRRPPEGSAG